MPHLRSTRAYRRRLDSWHQRAQEKIYFSLSYRDIVVGETVVTAEHDDYAYNFLVANFQVIAPSIINKEMGEVLSQGLKQ